MDCTLLKFISGCFEGTKLCCADVVPVPSQEPLTDNFRDLVVRCVKICMDIPYQAMFRIDDRFVKNCKRFAKEHWLVVHMINPEQC